MGPEVSEAGAFFERKNTKRLHGRVVNTQVLVLHWFLGSGGGGPQQGEVC